MIKEPEELREQYEILRDRYIAVSDQLTQVFDSGDEPGIERIHPIYQDLKNRLEIIIMDLRNYWEPFWFIKD